MSGFRRTEKIIFAIATIAFVATSYLLYDDSFLFPKSSNNQLSLVGSINFSQNDVRRKNEDAFSWMPASRSDKIFQNDSIFTGDRSEAELQLTSGSKIKIQSNSLITLNQKSGQMALDLRFGNVKGEIAAGQSMVFRSGKEEYVIENTGSKSEKAKLEIRQSRNGTTGIKVLSGRASFENKKTKNKAELTRTKVHLISKAGEVKQVAKAEMAVVEQFMADDAKAEIVKFDDIKPAEAKTEDSTAEESTIEQTKLEDSKEIQAATETQAEEVVAEAKAPVNQPEEKKPEVVATVPDNFSFERTKPNAPLTFAWQGKGDFSAYELEISQDKEFTTITSKSVTTDQQVQITDPLASGTYFWRLKGLDSKGQVLTVSQPQVMNVNNIDLPPPPLKEPPKKPILVTKNIVFKVPDAKERALASNMAPIIQWNKVNKVRSYQVQIATNSRFTDATTLEVKDTQVAWEQYHPGSYSYRVIARGINGLPSEPSEIGKIEVLVGDITLNPLNSVSKKGKVPPPIDVPISWREIPFTKKYLVQMDKDPRFSRPTEVEFASPGGILVLREPGQYSVRVQAFDERNQPLTSFSNTQGFSYTFLAPLDSPSLTEPFGNASIFLQTEMEPFIWLEWKKVDKSVSYRIEISDKPDFSRILIGQTVTKNRFLIKDKVPLGKIYWRVRANAQKSEETSLWSEVRDFTLHHQKNEIFVK